MIDSWPKFRLAGVRCEISSVRSFNLAVFLDRDSTLAKAEEVKYLTAVEEIHPAASAT